jgi:protease-4
VVTGRALSEATVRGFADGRVFTGAQGLELGLIDALGDEETARLMAAELADLDPEKTKPITFGAPPKRFGGLLPGRVQLRGLLDALSLELAWSGQPLWLYRP